MTICILLILAAAPPMPITDVTVFSGQAMIQRGGVVAVAPGETTVTLTGLPWELVDASIRVEVQGAVLQHVEVAPVHERLVRKEEAATLEHDVEALTATLADLAARSARLTERAGLLRQMRIGPRPVGPKDAPATPAVEPAAWLQVLDFAAAGMEQHDRDLVAIEAASADANQELEVLTTRLTRLRSKSVSRYKNVHLRLRASRTGRATVRVRYQVPGPQWFPRYEVRADVAGNTVQLEAYALVRQRTGEDWHDATLTVSTADLSASAVLPIVASTRYAPSGMQVAMPPADLEPVPITTLPVQEQGQHMSGSLDMVQQNLNGLRSSLDSFGGGKKRTTKAPSQVQRRYAQIRQLYQQQQQAKERGDASQYLQHNEDLNALLNTLPTKGKRALAALNQESLDNRAEAQRMLRSRNLEQGLTSPLSSAVGVDYRFGSPGKARVTSDWTLTRVPLLQRSLPVAFVYEAVPSKKELFFLTATGANPLQQPLLAGPLASFVGSDFVGEGRLSTTGSGQPLVFDLGVDREIEIRRQVERTRDTAGLILKDFRYRYVVTTTVINRRQRPVSVAVTDRVPVAAEDSGVTVEAVTVTPEPDWHTREKVRTGLLRWKLALEPGEERVMTMGYGVEHRTSRRLTGHEEGGVTW